MPRGFVKGKTAMAILVLEHDPNDRVAQLGRTLRDQGHKLRIVNLHRGDPLPPDLDNVDGVISLGGPMNVGQQDRHPWMSGELDLLRTAHDAGVPIVGICLGAQLIAAALGGEVAAMDQPEIGWHEVRLAFPGTMEIVLTGVPWQTAQFHVHGYQVTKLPPGATPLAGSKVCKNQAFKVGFKTYAFQYHFEWTREDLDAVLTKVTASAARGGFGAGVDLDAVRGQVETHYAMYRHLGDRQCGNLAAFVFAIDKRLGHHATIEPVANFHAGRS